MVGDGLFQYGGVPVSSDPLMPADAHMLVLSGGTPEAYWKSKFENTKIHTSLANAHTAVVSGQGDVVYVSMNNHVLPATTLSKSNVSYIGMGPKAFGYNPCYFTHTADQDVWITVSGANNAFYNLRFQHGGTSATNAHAIELTGAQNRFYWCHFDGPETTTEAAVSGYDLVKISEEYNYFENCLFGNPWNSMTDVSALLGFTGNKNCTTFFKNCVFQKCCGNTTNLFIHTYQSLNGGCHIHFENCSFQNTGTSTPQYAIDGYGLNTNNAMMTFQNCSFSGVTDVVASTYEAYVWFSGGGVYAANAQQNGLAANPDVS